MAGERAFKANFCLKKGLNRSIVCDEHHLSEKWLDASLKGMIGDKLRRFWKLDVFELHVVDNWKSLKISEYESDIISMLRIFICQLVCKIDAEIMKKKSDINKWVKLHRHEVMRVSTRMTDSKEQGDYEYCCGYS